MSGVTLRIDGAASQGTRMYPLAEATNSQSYNGFHRAFIPEIFKKIRLKKSSKAIIQARSEE